VARRALAIAALAAVAVGSGTTTTVVDWVAAHDMIDVPYVRDCQGILRHPEECPIRPEPARTSALR
jgi:tetrahydromethanopterin S-methyltransferase subunit C